jgi:transcriptional regulator with XRE-family HTH domain
VTDSTQSDPESWVGLRFRELRKERGWSQDDLARRMEELGWPMHQTTVAKLEAGKRPIRLNEVAHLAMLYGLKLSDFLAGGPAEQPSCRACSGRPPAGFTCNTCGRSGS